MKIREWFALRGARFVGKRATALLRRYGVTPAQAERRIWACLSALAENGCAPTFPTPGYVVERYPRFFQELQDAGAEIAVHSYHHVDLRAYPPTEAVEQLVRALRTLRLLGIEVHGFRCPYLSCSRELLQALPRHLFGYSSNWPVSWDGIGSTPAGTDTMFDTIGRLYRGAPAASTLCLPRLDGGMVEIPVCVPDDLQLFDGLRLDGEGVQHAWGQVLKQTHDRGELFSLLFHPELADECQQPLVGLLREADRLRPSVWLARLRDLNDWWREKASFGARVDGQGDRLRISFLCSGRATILARELGDHCSGPAWEGRYYRLQATQVEVPASPRPFVGLCESAPPGVETTLREQGYIVESGEEARHCAVRLESETLRTFANDLELTAYIEASSGPLIRYWRWPAGAKSALCISGDLDALTLLDYAARLAAR